MSFVFFTCFFFGPDVIFGSKILEKGKYIWGWFLWNELYELYRNPVNGYLDVLPFLDNNYCLFAYSVFYYDKALVDSCIIVFFTIYSYYDVGLGWKVIRLVSYLIGVAASSRRYLLPLFIP